MWNGEFMLRWKIHLLDCCTNQLHLLKFIFTLLSSMLFPAIDTFNYKVNNVPCCGTAFERFWNISNYTRRHVMECIRSGVPVTAPHGNEAREHLNFKTRLVKVRLTSFCLVCEQQANSNGVHTVECYQKIDINDAMISEMRFYYSSKDLQSA